MKKSISSLIAPKELRSRYEAYGHFYILKLGRNKRYNCRSVMEIVSSKTVSNKLTDELPDAVLIMMNPGSSYPLGDVRCNVYDKDTIGNLQPVLCKAEPDDTQDQTMRLMDLMGWSHVRVINLSDLRKAQSSAFYKMLGGIEGDLHSIFSQSRRQELQSRLNCKPNAPIICAWGVDNQLDSLSEKARIALSEYDIVGLRKDGLKFYHPYPRNSTGQLNWLNEVASQVHR